MAIALDGSTPTGVSQTNGATATVVSGSFSPPAGSVIVVSWAGNSASAVSPTAPSIANSAGLTFTSLGVRNYADGSKDGQAAMWYHVVGSTPGSMTVTITNNASSGNRHARLKVLVFTGVDTASPIGANSEGTDTTGALDALSYTSTVANSIGVAAVSDWDVNSTTFTAAAGTTVADSASVASSINCATLTQTTPTTSGASIALGLTAPTSSAWNYVYAELKPATGTTAPAEGPAGTGTAYDAGAAVATAAGGPAGTGTAPDAPAGVTAVASAATGTGTAYDATVSTGSVSYDTLYTGGTLPTIGGSDDDSPLTVGIAFSVLAPGQIVGVRVHTATTETGAWTVQLHDTAGSLIASGTGPSNPGSGDYDVLFSAPVDGDEAEIYTASVFHPEGRYSYTLNQYAADFTSASGNLFAGFAGSYGPGRYAYGGTAAYPNITAPHWYGVEPLFAASSPSNTTAPAESAGGTGTAYDATVAVAAAAEVATGSGAANSATAGQGTAAAAQAAAGTGTAHDATVAIKASAEVATGTGTAGQATVSTGGYETLFDGTPPTLTGSEDDATLTLGQAFSVLVDGTVAGVRVHTGIAETGAWTVKLYNNAGTELATGTGPTDPGSGVYDVLFTTPASVDTATIYVAAVFHPEGKYSYTTDRWTADYTAPNGHVFAGLGGSYGPGRYVYGGTVAYPNTNSDDWYGIEPLFLAAAPAGTTAPAENASGSGAADNASVAVTAGAESATGTGAALWDSTGDSISLELSALAAIEGTGTAYDATVATGGTSTATAEPAPGTGTAHAATVAITAAATGAAGTGTANDTPVALGAAAEAASGTGSADNAVVQIPGATTAPAEVATGTGAAQDALAVILAAAEAATGTGAALDATIAVLVAAEAALGSGAALQPFVSGPVRPGESTDAVTARRTSLASVS